MIKTLSCFFFFMHFLLFLLPSSSSCSFSGLLAFVFPAFFFLPFLLPPVIWYNRLRLQNPVKAKNKEEDEERRKRRSRRRRRRRTETLKRMRRLTIPLLFLVKAKRTDYSVFFQQVLGRSLSCFGGVSVTFGWCLAHF